jgi:acyl-CoA thioesterase-1
MMLPRLRRSLKETDFDLVIWQVGSNDAISTGNAAAFRSAMDQGIETILASGSDLLLLDQQYVEPWRDKQNWQHYVALVEIGAKNKAVNVLSRYQSMKRLHGRDLRALEGLLAPDAIHMNDKGYACLAEAIGLSIQTLAGPSQARIDQRQDARGRVGKGQASGCVALPRSPDQGGQARCCDEWAAARRPHAPCDR